MVWFPILNSQNFPDVSPAILLHANQSHRCFAWSIEEAEDLLHIPEGLTGWLLPIDQADTDVVVGLWEGELHFVAAVDQGTGQPQTLLSSKGRCDRFMKETGLTWLMPTTARSLVGLNQQEF